jgi:hypothetical protein
MVLLPPAMVQILLIAKMYFMKLAALPVLMTWHRAMMSFIAKSRERYPGKIGFLKKREAIVYTHAKQPLKEFMQQSRRWASKSTRYKDKKMVVFVLSIWLCNFMLMLTGSGPF